MYENPTTWLATAIIVLLAAILQGVTGFGFALISIPLLLLLYDPHTAVGINIIISFVSLSILTLKVRQAVLPTVVKNLFLGSILGIPLGTYLFLHSDVRQLKLAIGIITIIFSLFLLSGLTIKKVAGHLWERTVGCISGVLTGSIGMPGPPVILFLSNQELSKERFRATTAAYFALVYPASLFILITIGAINYRIALTAISLTPFAIMGGQLGYFLFQHVPQTQFQRGVTLLVIGTALYAVLSTILNY